jgi:DNA helicase-2/ATP-dependent DNA helicase PcrA
LHISFSQTRMLHGQTRYNIKSRFLDELPEAALKWLTPRNQGFGSGFAKSYQDAWASGKGMGSMVGAGAQPYRSNTGSSGYAGGSRGGYGGQPYGAKRGEDDFKDLTAPLPTKMAQAKTEGGLRVGQSVFHNKFGEGVVLTLEGNGPDARVQVNFGRHGTKWLMLSVAKLTPIE